MGGGAVMGGGGGKKGFRARRDRIAFLPLHFRAQASFCLIGISRKSRRKEKASSLPPFLPPLFIRGKKGKTRRPHGYFQAEFNELGMESNGSNDG